MILNPFVKVFLCSVTPDVVLSLCCAFTSRFRIMLLIIILLSAISAKFETSICQVVSDIGKAMNMKTVRAKAMKINSKQGNWNNTWQYVKLSRKIIYLHSTSQINIFWWRYSIIVNECYTKFVFVSQRKLSNSKVFNFAINLL